MKKILFSILIVITGISCDESDNNVSISCADSIIISKEMYDEDTLPIKINSALIYNDCIEIILSYSGCDKTTFKLMDAGIVAESLPVQRSMKLLAENPASLCLAFFADTVYFDLKKTQIEGGGDISFTLDKWEDRLLYSY